MFFLVLVFPIILFFVRGHIGTVGVVHVQMYATLLYYSQCVVQSSQNSSISIVLVFARPVRVYGHFVGIISGCAGSTSRSYLSSRGESPLPHDVDSQEILLGSWHSSSSPGSILRFLFACAIRSSAPSSRPAFASHISSLATLHAHTFLSLVHGLNKAVSFTFSRNTQRYIRGHDRSA